jgi:hypothetical protein
VVNGPLTLDLMSRSSLKCLWTGTKTHSSSAQVGFISWAADVIDRVERVRDIAGHIQQNLRDRLLLHRAWIMRFGIDMPEIREWCWREPCPVGND